MLYYALYNLIHYIAYGLCILYKKKCSEVSRGRETQTYLEEKASMDKEMPGASLRSLNIQTQGSNILLSRLTSDHLIL